MDTDPDTGACFAFDRPFRFDADGKPGDAGKYAIRGWIAIARRSNDLDSTGGDDDNLNRITIVVRGKVAQEDILQEFRLGGMITKYLFGEIEADFLDQDHREDIATSSRQRISEDDERYRALRSFVESELKHIWTKTNSLRDKRGLADALATNPHLKQWYDALRPRRLQKFAVKIFGDIDRAGIDESERQNAYANGVLLFEHLKMNRAMDVLEKIDATNVGEFIEYLAGVDALEAEHYRQIVDGRLKVINRLQAQVLDDAKERVLQEYIFDHLYLLDPAWERATGVADMERRVSEALERKRTLRIDIKYTKYRRVAAAHVIVELKRASVRLDKTDIEKQVRDYIDALRDEIQKSPKEAALPIEAICIVGELPRGWEDEERRKRDEESLRPLAIRVVTYDELIDNARSAYADFIEASQSSGELRSLIEKIRTYEPDSDGG